MNEITKKVIGLIKKYKYVALVLLIGIVLLMIPSGEKEKIQVIEAKKDENLYALEMQERICAMLTQIEGAGRVDVMLTLAYGSRTEYHADVQLSSDTGGSNEERKTVILSEGSAYDKAAVSAVRYPQFQGALIVCEGADSASVRLDILNAVSALTGLGADRITVVKMN